MKTLMRWTPMSELTNLRSEFDRLFDTAFEGMNLPSARWGAPGWVDMNVAVDLTENEDAYVVEAAIPGVDPNDLDITIADSVLTIRGETKTDEEKSNKNYHIRERRYGSFCRSITLPATVAADDISADYTDGILKLTLPKTEEVKPRRIEVRTKNRHVLEGEVSP